MSPTREDLLRLLRWVGVTEAREMNCDQFMHCVAGFVERIRDGGDLSAEDKDVLQHMSVCAECVEEYVALFRALRDELDGALG